MQSRCWKKFVLPSASEDGDEPIRAPGAFIRAVNVMSTAGGYLAALAIVAILVLICVEMGLRNVLGKSTMISDEVAGYLNAAVIFLGLAHALRERAFIRVEVLYERFRGRFLLFARWLITLLSIAYVGLLLYAVTKQVIYLYKGDIRSDGLSQTPLYMPQMVIVLGCVLLFLQLLTYAIDRVRNIP
jgi:TRAP-type C4-dicarboxylate transport system permease small subunit